MKRAVILILLALTLAQAVAAVSITLNAPANGSTATTGEVAFSCIADNLGTVTSLTLKLDPGTGAFADKYTSQYLAIPEDPMPIIMLDYIIPPEEAFADGTYKWKCTASDGTESAVQTFTVGIPVTSFTGTIPSQNLTAGEPKSNAFDLDSYFTNAETFIARGNSTVQVMIDTQHIVSLFAESAVIENITFTSRNVTSNGVTVTATAGNQTGIAANLTGLLTGAPAPTIESYQPTENVSLPPGGMQAFTITKPGNATASWYLDDEAIEGATGDSYTYQNATAGTHTVKAVVSEGGEEASHTWTVTVAGEAEGGETEPEAAEEIEEASACGDGTCDAGEDCLSCEKDCECGSGEACEAGLCVEKARNNTLTWIIIAMLVAGGAAAAFLLTKRKPKEKAEEEAPTETADVSEFYKRTEIKPEEKGPTLFPKKSPGAKYVQAMRAKGTPDAEIKNNLKSKGWTDQQIEEAFK